MIYFLVNNNFHVDFDIRLAVSLQDQKAGLIQVPYSLNVIEDHPLFEKIFCFNRRLHASLIRFLIHPFEIPNAKRKVYSDIRVSEEDILLVHNEIDLTNHLIIQRFFENNSRVYLLEDGTSTMCTYNLKPTKAPLKEQLKFFILRKIFNFKYSRIYRYGAQVLPVMDDHIFSGLIVNYGDSVLRNIKVYKLRSSEETINNLDLDSAIFFSQPLYIWYMTEQEYITLIEEILEVSSNFNILYFKFHPSEKEDVKTRIKHLIETKKNVSLIEEDEIAEKIIVKYPVKYAVTFNSTAALNLIIKGVVPVFLNNIVSRRFPSPSLLQFDNFLCAIKCNTPSEILQVRPGFCAFTALKVTTSTHTISEILN